MENDSYSLKYFPTVINRSPECIFIKSEVGNVDLVHIKHDVAIINSSQKEIDLNSISKTYYCVKNDRSALLKFENCFLDMECQHVTLASDHSQQPNLTETIQSHLTTKNENLKNIGVSLLRQCRVVLTRCDDAKYTLPEQSYFVCNICNEVFSQKEHLQSHTKCHSSYLSITSKFVQCEFCNYKVSLKSDLVKHVRIHTKEKPFQCDYCDYTCTNKSALVRHIRKHTGEKPYNCNICSYSSRNSTCLQRHLKVHTGLKQFQCDICDHKFSQKEALQDHMNLHTGIKPYDCKFCSYTSAHKTGLRRHINRMHQVHNESQSYKCKVCNYETTSRRELFKHTEHHLKDKTTNLEASPSSLNQDFVIKEEVTNSKSGLLTEISGNSLVCDICNKNFLHEGQLKNHTKYHSSYLGITSKFLQCEFCDYKVPFKSALVKHVRIHTKEKPFQCDYCDYTCTNKSALVRHIRKHTGEKPYNCNICSYSSRHSTCLQRHLKVHAGLKQFQCHICDHKFSQKEALQDHMNTHTGTKPYKCKFCDYTSAHKTGLRSHINRMHQVHNESQSYKCKVCNYKTTSRKELFKHAEHHMKDKTTNPEAFPSSLNLDLVIKEEVTNSKSGLLTGLVCDICNKNFTHEEQLKNHTKYHSSHVCIKSTLDIQNLNNSAISAEKPCFENTVIKIEINGIEFHNMIKQEH